MNEAVELAPMPLLLLEIDVLVDVLGDTGADLGGSLAGLGHGVSIEGLLRAGGALGAVQTLITTAQAGVAESAVATAVAGELVNHVTYFGGLLIDVHLPGIAEVFTSKPGSGEDRRQRADLERSGGMIGRDLVCRVGPLRVADGGDGEDGETEDKAAIGQDHFRMLSPDYSRRASKKMK
jgi:hypothetical protein